MPVLNLQRSYKYIMYATKQPSLRINQADLKCKTGCGYYGTAECNGECSITCQLSPGQINPGRRLLLDLLQECAGEGAEEAGTGGAVQGPRSRLLQVRGEEEAADGQEEQVSAEESDAGVQEVVQRERYGKGTRFIFDVIRMRECHQLM